VAFRFTGVGGKRPPNIVESRIAGSGTLSFGPVYEDQWADTGSIEAPHGRVVFEYDVLTPHPQTFRIVALVLGGSYIHYSSDLGERMKLRVEVVGARSEDGVILRSCNEAKGTITLVDTHRVGHPVSAFEVMLPSCKIHYGQVATTGRNSRVHVNLTPHCLRTTAARKPLCGESHGATFTLRPALTEVKNAWPTELTINAAGGNAVWDHTKSGGATWNATYTFKAPATLVPGKTATMPFGMSIQAVNPPQPLALQISVLGPGFRKDLPAHFPDNASVSASAVMPIAASYATATELTITVGIDQGQIIYHYKR
jgi:hypothetical protein